MFKIQTCKLENAYGDAKQDCRNLIVSKECLAISFLKRTTYKILNKVNQHVADALAAQEANQNNENGGGNGNRNEARSRNEFNKGVGGVAPDLIKLMIEVYCLRNEIHKLENELWNLSAKGTDIAGYTRWFQELALLYLRMVPEEEDKIKRSCQKVDYMARDCKAALTATTQRALGASQRTIPYYECGKHGHFRSDCPKLKNQNHGNQAIND
nr:hypothetical protein [Tanacetum cinerariifolium]